MRDKLDIIVSQVMFVIWLLILGVGSLTALLFIFKLLFRLLGVI